MDEVEPTICLESSYNQFGSLISLSLNEFMNLKRGLLVCWVLMRAASNSITTTAPSPHENEN